MNKKSFNEMTYEEKTAYMDSFIDGLKGEDWDNFLVDTQYELYKNIICPFLDDDFSPIDINNTAMSFVKIDLSTIHEITLDYEFTYDYKVALKSREHIADNYGYKLAA